MKHLLKKTAIAASITAIAAISSFVSAPNASADAFCGGASCSFEHANYQGAAFAPPWDQGNYYPNLNNMGWGDRISSIRNWSGYLGTYACVDAWSKGKCLDITPKNPEYPTLPGGFQDSISSIHIYNPYD